MIKEFFGFGGYTREAEGFLSWQHLTFVSLLHLITILLAVILGVRSRNKDLITKNRVLIAAALGLDGIELLKVLLICTVGGRPMGWLNELPLYLCSIQLITLPIAAFSRGKFKEAALDFVAVFGMLGALLGTYGAGNNYACYPVLSFDNVTSGLTHCISGFASLYILITGMASMKKESMRLCFRIILGFSFAAWSANSLLDHNYMFLRRGDGTPYDLLYALVSGNPVLYPLCVVTLFLIYIAAFYKVFHVIRKIWAYCLNKREP